MLVPCGTLRVLESKHCRGAADNITPSLGFFTSLNQESDHFSEHQTNRGYQLFNKTLKVRNVFLWS